MPICNRCKIDKPISEFNPKKDDSRGHQSACKLCQAAYNREWYRVKRQAVINRTKLRAQSIRDECRRNLLDYLADHHCVDCGENDPIVLEFDHVDPSQKKNSVAKMVHSGCLWETIAIEIAKCEVRCANCHRKRSAKQFGWYAYLA